MGNSKIFLTRFALFVILFSASIATFNAIVDPYGLYGFVEIKGFNQQKEGVRENIRLTKTLQLPQRKPKTVLLGSSRVHDGMNPSDSQLEPFQPVYNLGIDMLRIKEALYFLEHAEQNSDIKHVVFGIDYFMFNANEILNPSFDNDLVGKKIWPLDYISKTLLSKNALINSIRTIQISRASPERREFLDNGYRPGEFVFYRLRDYRKLHSYTNSIFLGRNVVGTPYYGYFETTEENYEDFRSILDFCKKKNIQIHLYISPAHAKLDGEVVRFVGLWNAYEEWKRRIVKLSEEFDVPIWDFSGYNSITTEEVKTPMEYYWDSSHFTEKVASMILSKVLGTDTNGVGIPKDFGARLSSNTIENHLQMIRDERDRYMMTHPEEINDIRKLNDNAVMGRNEVDVSNMFF